MMQRYLKYDMSIPDVAFLWQLPEVKLWDGVIEEIEICEYSVGCIVRLLVVLISCVIEQVFYACLLH